MTHDTAFEQSRIIALEEKLAHQEHAVAELGDALYAQQRRIEALEDLGRELLEQVRRLREGREGGESAPPHY